MGGDRTVTSAAGKRLACRGRRRGSPQGRAATARYGAVRDGSPDNAGQCALPVSGVSSALGDKTTDAGWTHSVVHTIRSLSAWYCFSILFFLVPLKNTLDTTPWAA